MTIESIPGLDAINPNAQPVVNNPIIQNSGESFSEALASSLHSNQITMAQQMMYTRETNNYLQSLHNQKQNDFNRKYGRNYRRELSDQAQLVGVSIPDVVAQFKPGVDPLKTNVFNVKYQSEALQTQLHAVSDMISRSKSVIDKLASNG